MIFKETKIKGAYIISLERIEDDRGFFARSFCGLIFEEQGLNPCIEQCNISYSKKKGTLHGMHYQIFPYQEVKLVRCTMGSIYDVIVDLRPESPTCKQWVGEELTANNHKMIYVPKGFAHGYLTLEDNTEIFYQVSEYYNGEYERTLRWDNSEVGIEWPKMDRYIISPKDQSVV